MDHLAAVVVAAGRGQRLGSGANKVFLPLAGRPMLAWSLIALEQSPSVLEIVVVVGPGEEEYCWQIVHSLGFSKLKRILPGGKERQYSVLRGVDSLEDRASLVLIHDGARPLVSPALIEDTIGAAQKWGAAVTAVPVKDTIKIADSAGFVVKTPDRSRLWTAQTPQVFRYAVLRTALERLRQEGDSQFTDDSSLVELCGHPVKLVAGSYSNLKVTTPEDLLLAEALLSRSACAGDVPLSG